ncbi:hypothetical protein [Acinetobacter phage HFM1]|nr:hypothetical protein [Acinetobacter phage HFM1]
MKTANELAQEYFAKSPMERLHTTLQDYVYDYQKTKIDGIKILLSIEIESCKKGIEMAERTKASQLSIVYRDKLLTLEHLMDFMK